MIDDEKIQLSLSQWAQSLLVLDDKPFSLEERKYLLPVYDNGYKRMLLKCGRQVEKSLVASCLVTTSENKLVLAKDIKVGDKLASLNRSSQEMTSGEVTWRSKLYTKPCLKMTTRQGHRVKIAYTHPVAVFNGWKEGGELRVGDRIAVVRRCGEFLDKSNYSDEEITVLAALIGDGYIHDGDFKNKKCSPRSSFTQAPNKLRDEYKRCLEVMGIKYSISRRKNSATQSISHTHPDIIKESGLIGKKSATKFIPGFVFELPRRQTALFLNRLWATDGHVKQNTKSKYSIEYCSISKQLIKEVQALLWKFGIPSRIRENWPSIYKRRGEKKLAYILRVETAEGVCKFLDEVGALGKSENIPLPDLISDNNNMDTWPLEISALINKIYESNGIIQKRGRFTKAKSMRSADLRPKPKYCPTKRKLEKYVTFFKDGNYDQSLVAELENHINGDIYWDRIVFIEDIGEQECVDFTVGPHNNFIVEGIVTHNSTTIAAFMLSLGTAQNGLGLIYGAPSDPMVRTFSHQKLTPLIALSPAINNNFLNTRLAMDNVYEKRFDNGTTILLRNSHNEGMNFRGPSGDVLALDEIQDMEANAIPIAREMLFHADPSIKLFLDAGTPKTVNNPIEKLWLGSTMTEWLIPCERCGGASITGNVKGHHQYWNNIGVRNMSPYGLICSKCGEKIYPLKGQWVDMAPDARTKGFRISQPMTPMVDMEEIYYDKLQKYPISKFMNEVLGISHDSASVFISQAALMRCCTEEAGGGHLLVDVPNKDTRQYPAFAGIDWGVGVEDGGATVLMIGIQVGGGKIKLVYARKFTNTMPLVDQTKIIVQKLNEFNVQLVCADWGAAGDRNAKIAESVGVSRILQVQYVGASTFVNRYQGHIELLRVSRTLALSDVRTDLVEKGLFALPRWEMFKPFAEDILNEFVEEDHAGNLRYNHPLGSQDDSLHALTYLNLARKIHFDIPIIKLTVNVGDEEDFT